MKSAPLPPDEEARLKALDATGLLDTPPAPEFDGLTELAARILNMPIALVSLVDRHRQWFKSRFGLQAAETPRDWAFCAHAILEPKPLIVDDAWLDDRFADNPLVTGDPNVRFYAGVPLIDRDGYALGTLCVIDRVPRTLSEDQLKVLEVLARQVSAQAELRTRARELEVARNRLREVLRGASDLIQSVGIDGRVQFVNRSWLQRLGYDESEVLGSPVWRFIDPQEHEKCQSLFSLALGGTPLPLLRTSFVTKSQQRVLVEGRIDTVSENGSLVSTFGIFRDVTERAAWEEDRERFFDLSLDLICVCDCRGVIQRASRAWQTVLGYSVEDLREKQICDLVHPDDRAAAGLEFERVKGGAATVWYENRWLARDGCVRWISWAATLSRDNQRLYASGRDVTTRRETEDQLRSQAELIDLTHDAIIVRDLDGKIRLWNRGAQKLFGFTAEEALGQDAPTMLRTRFPVSRAEIETQFQKLGHWDGTLEKTTKAGRVVTVSSRWVLQSNAKGEPSAILETLSDVTHKTMVEKLKSEFVSTVSHELRTPLTSIRGSLRLLEAGAAGPVPEKAAGLIKIAHSNSERLIRLVNDLLDLEKIESGQLELTLAEIELSEVMAAAIDSTRGMAEQHGVELSATVPAGSRLEADFDRLVQALTNLLSNAVKWSPRGKRVQVTVSRHVPGWLRFVVADEGPGIPQDKLPLLFRRFQQLDASDTRQKGGTGLGLAITKAIIDQHGGQIGARSGSLLGTEFWFDLPESRRSAPSLARPLVLVIAEPEKVGFLAATMEERAYRVVRASSVDEALRLLHESLPNAIVLDLQIERSLTLIERVRRGPSTRTIPIVLAARDAGGTYSPTFIDWLEAPVERGRLVDAVKLNHRRNGRPKLLVVDDDEQTRTLIAAELEREGLECIQADSGQRGIDLANAVRPDLIILDVQMPQLDGFGVVESLRGGPSAGIPLLVYSGLELGRADRDALHLGVTRFLTKSRVSEQHFVNTVLELLNEAVKPVAPSGSYQARPRTLSPRLSNTNDGGRGRGQ